MVLGSCAANAKLPAAKSRLDLLNLDAQHCLPGLPQCERRRSSKLPTPAEDNSGAG